MAATSTKVILRGCPEALPLLVHFHFLILYRSVSFYIFLSFDQGIPRVTCNILKHSSTATYVLDPRTAGCNEAAAWEAAACPGSLARTSEAVPRCREICPKHDKNWQNLQIPTSKTLDLTHLETHLDPMFAARSVMSMLFPVADNKSESTPCANVSIATSASKAQSELQGSSQHQLSAISSYQ